MNIPIRSVMVTRLVMQIQPVYITQQSHSTDPITGSTYIPAIHRLELLAKRLRVAVRKAMLLQVIERRDLSHLAMVRIPWIHHIKAVSRILKMLSHGVNMGLLLF